MKIGDVVEIAAQSVMGGPRHTRRGRIARYPGPIVTIDGVEFVCCGQHWYEGYTTYDVKVVEPFEDTPVSTWRPSDQEQR